MNYFISDELLSLFHESHQFDYFRLFFRSLDIAFNDEAIPDHFVDRFKQDYNRLVDVLKKKDELMYCQRLMKNMRIFDLIKDIRVDRLALAMYKRLEKHEGNISLLNSFKDGDKIMYSRLGTVTGRLSVIGGPRLLNLPKKYRGILRSRFVEGEILMIDFKSLEPRVAKYLTGGDTQEEDIYQDIINGLGYIVDRVVMKRAVLSILYGMSEEQTKIGELSDDRVKDIRQRVFEYFKIDELLHKALKKSSCGYYQTFFGRPIHWDKDVQLHQVLNGYIQGTAVDVALSGFLSLIEEFDDGMVPIGLIHDAMLVDVSKENKNKFVKLIEAGYNCKDLGRFTFSIETISQRKI